MCAIQSIKMFDLMPETMLNITQFYINKKDDRDNTLVYFGNDTQCNAGIKVTNVTPV